MTCCAADLTPCGFVCKWAQADTLATDTWVTVTGTLYQRQYADHSEPQLQVQSVLPPHLWRGIFIRIIKK